MKAIQKETNYVAYGHGNLVCHFISDTLATKYNRCARRFDVVVKYPTANMSNQHDTFGESVGKSIMAHYTQPQYVRYISVCTSNIKSPT